MERDLGKRHCDARAHGEDNLRPSYRLGLGMLTDQLQPRTMTDACRRGGSRALHRQRAAIGDGQRFADRKAKTRAALGAVVGQFQLLKGVEDHVVRLFKDAAAVTFDFDIKAGRRQPCAQRDIAIFGEFERVADKIGQDLQATRPVRKGHNLFAVDRDLKDFSAAAVAN